MLSLGVLHKKERKMTLTLPKEWFVVSLHIKCTQKNEMKDIWYDIRLTIVLSQLQLLLLWDLHVPYTVWVVLMIEATTITNKVYIASCHVTQSYFTIAMISFTNTLEQGSHVSFYSTQTLCVNIMASHNYSQIFLFGYFCNTFGRIKCHKKFVLNCKLGKNLWPTIHKPWSYISPQNDMIKSTWYICLNKVSKSDIK